MRERRPARHLRPGTLVAAAFGLGLVSGTEYWAGSALAGHPLPWLEATGYEVVKWLLWAALTPAISGGAAAIGGLRPRWLALPAHAATALGATVLQVTAYALFVEVVVGGARGAAIFGAIGVFLANKTAAGIVTYAAIVTAWHALDLRARHRERELASLRLEARLSEARLDALQLQLQPHFLFNTLNAASSLVVEGRGTDAVRMLGRLAELLRRTLKSTPREATLEEELVLVDTYLDIERVRFGDRLDVALEIDETCLPARVPVLLLQPLVENAVRHALGGGTATGRVVVGARRCDGCIELRVDDDGAGFPERPGAGIGLANTAARLEARYGDDAELVRERSPAGGARVRIRLPLDVTTGAAESVA